MTTVIFISPSRPVNNPPTPGCRLGRATAARFSENDATVVILNPDTTQARAAAADLGPQRVGVACTLANKADCETAVTGRLAC